MARHWGRLARLDEAINKAVSSINMNIGIEEEDLWYAVNRILAIDVKASRDNPPYDRSAVDGYAVKSSDIIGASSFNPIRLVVKGCVKPGEPLDDNTKLDHGEAIEVLTGSFIPRGADAVVMYEDVVVGNGFIEVLKPVPKWSNISRRGEDFSKGEVIVGKKTLLRPWHLAIIASQGITRIPVYRRVKIGIVSIGDELVKPGYPAPPYKAYAFTEYLVKTMINELGFVETRYYGIVGDDVDSLTKTMDTILSENDAAITIAGTSVSKQDIVPDYVESHGRWVVRGIALRPGRTTSLGIVDDKPVFLLSGNPVAAWVGVEAFIIPVITRILGVKLAPKPTIKAVLKRRVTNQVGFRSFVRVFVEKTNRGYEVEPYMVHGSSILSSLVKTNGYVVLEEDVEGHEEGDEVEVVLLNPL